MDKIKINLISGASLEKPLITAFRSNGGDYVVLDNEINGTMGLPIILVSKLENNGLVKVADKSPEWEAVKESLRLIIAGNQIDYITVSPELGAQDVFFSQLTLPIASFEALKNNYKPAGSTDTSSVPSTPVANQAPATAPSTPEPVTPAPAPVEASIAPAVETVVAAPTAVPVTQAPAATAEAITPETVVPVVAPSSEPTPVTPSAETLTPEPVTSAPAPVEASVTPAVETVVAAPTQAPVTPEVVVPTPNPVPETPVMPEAPAASQAVAEVQTAPPTETPVDFTADKEAFLKACENMFDALVAKFKN